MPKRTAGHFVPFESLRGVAAWSIVTYHVWLFTSTGSHLKLSLGPATALLPPLQSGVTLFFVLSGFLLYRPWTAGAGPSFASYLRNRALRILPAYWLVVIVSTLVGTATLRVAHGTAIVGRLSTEQLVQSLTLTQGYHPHTIFNGIPPAWSLGVEAGFYLLLPLAALAGRKSVWLPPALLLTGGFAGKIALAAVGISSTGPFASTWQSTLAHSLLSHADLFGFGMVAAVLFSRYDTTWAGHGRVGRLLAYTGVPWLVLGYYFVPSYVYESGVAFLAAVVLLRVLHSPQRLLETRVARASGRLSYSVFLWNFPVLAFMSVHHLLAHGGPLPFLINAAFVALIVAGLSWLSYRYVEAPALRLKRRGGKTLDRPVHAQRIVDARPTAKSSLPIVELIP